MEALPATILVVEDSSFNQKILSAYMKEEGYEVILATQGEEALMLAVEKSPDLVLLDIILPDITGYEVCRRLKENPILTHIPVIFLTSLSDRDDIVAGFTAGGVDYILKPFFPEELKARVKTQVTLKFAYDEITRLQRIIPICASCKSIRNDSGYWETVETYLSDHSHFTFTHGMCPVCEERLYGDKEWWQKAHDKTKQDT